MYARKIGHHTAHHTTGQTTTKQQRAHQLVGGVDKVAQPLVNELLCQCARLHVSAHIDFGNIETFVLQHALHRDNVGMNLTPRQWFDGRIDDIGTVVAHFQYRSHRQTRGQYVRGTR